jgi:site-specific recombinase XerD
MNTDGSLSRPGVSLESTVTTWDSRLISRFSDRSISEETRRAYRRVLREFFVFVNQQHPLQVTADDVLRWRDDLRRRRKKSATISFKLSVVRSFFEYLRAAGLVNVNPASTKLVAPPVVSNEGAGRALTLKEVSHVLAGPNRQRPEGARDYAILLLMLRTSLRVSEVCSLKLSSIKWSHGRWIIKFTVKGGRERTLPLPVEVKKAIDEYIKLDQKRREVLLSDGEEAHLFQPITNYRTLVFDKLLTIPLLISKHMLESASVSTSSVLNTFEMPSK